MLPQMLELTIASVLEAAIASAATALSPSQKTKSKKLNAGVPPLKNGVSLSTSVRKPGQQVRVIH
jgi:hypothetical protein